MEKNPASSWSIAEKKQLLVTLQTRGTHDPVLLMESFPHKSFTEIREVYQYYSKLAKDRLMERQELEQSKDDEEIPIAKWIKILRDLNDKNAGITDIVPRVLKYISLFEKRSDEPDMINLRECYMVLSQVCGGKPPAKKKLNEETSQFLFHNLTQLANILKHHQNKKQVKFIREYSTVSGRARKTYGGRKIQTELQNNPVLNPLKVPNDLLSNIVEIDKF